MSLRLHIEGDDLTFGQIADLFGRFGTVKVNSLCCDNYYDVIIKYEWFIIAEMAYKQMDELKWSDDNGHYHLHLSKPTPNSKFRSE